MKESKLILIITKMQEDEKLEIIRTADDRSDWSNHNEERSASCVGQVTIGKQAEMKVLILSISALMQSDLSSIDGVPALAAQIGSFIEEQLIDSPILGLIHWGGDNKGQYTNVLNEELSKSGNRIQFRAYSSNIKIGMFGNTAEFIQKATDITDFVELAEFLHNPTSQICMRIDDALFQGKSSIEITIDQYSFLKKQSLLPDEGICIDQSDSLTDNLVAIGSLQSLKAKIRSSKFFIHQA